MRPARAVCVPAGVVALALLPAEAARAELPPAPSFSLSVDRRIDATAAPATVSGTVTCTDAFLVVVNGRLTQGAGRSTATASFFFMGAAFRCDGTPERWTAGVTSTSGRLHGGRSAVSTVTQVCGIWACVERSDTHTVLLRGSGRP